jgi:type II secretory pathway pseudopilin PulG
VAIAILGVGVVMVIQLFSGTLRTAKKSGDYSTALMYARSLMEEAYAAQSASSIPGVFDHEEHLEGERTVRLLSTDELAKVYEITVAVRWSSSGRVQLKGRKVFYEKTEED